MGLISYSPLRLIIVPKEELPRVSGHPEYIESPLFLNFADSSRVNDFAQLGLPSSLRFSDDILEPEDRECLPASSRLLNLKSDFILKAIFKKDNFRIWDMNIRGFLREHIFQNVLSRHRIVSYPVAAPGTGRADKRDLVLRSKDGAFVKFQIKGLTWGSCRLDGSQTLIDCETQLSRGRVNDHPTQSRLYLATDFDFLIIALEPPYTQALTLAAWGEGDFGWQFYCLPMDRLQKHPSFPNRVFSHQRILFRDLKAYAIDESWFGTWEVSAVTNHGGRP